MILRWCLAGLGGALWAAVFGALAGALTPGAALAGIALGVMVSVVSWVGFALVVMSTQDLGRFVRRAGLVLVVGLVGVMGLVIL